MEPHPDLPASLDLAQFKGAAHGRSVPAETAEHHRNRFQA